MRRSLLVAVVFAFFAIAAPKAAIAQPGSVRIDPNPGVTFERLTLLSEDPLDPFADEKRLPPEDEVRLSHALTLVRTSRTDEGLAEIRDLISRYPQSRRIVSASATALTRAGRPEEALKILESAVSRQKDEWLRAAAPKADAPAGEVAPPSRRPSNAPRSSRDLYARERADALIALGEIEKALPFAASACELHPRSSGRLRALLFECAGLPETANAAVDAVAKRSDAAPERIELALLAAEVEVRAGRAAKAWDRLRRTELRTDESLRGRLVRVIAQRLSTDPAVASLGTATWMELARGPYDDRLRFDAIQRLLAPDPLVPGAPRYETVLPGGPRAEGSRTAAPSVALADIEAAWRALPPGDDRTRTGLLLLEEAEQRGEPAVASRVRNELAHAAPIAGFGGALAVQRGLAALERGSLDDARRGFHDAIESEPEGAAAEEAMYLLAEIEFYAEHFDTARAGYDAFSRAHPANPLANDALDRAYLLEAGNGSPLPGLAALAKGLYAERRQRWDEAATLAREAESQAGAVPADPAQPPPVRAHALLLLSRVEEARGAMDAALAAALLCADSLAADRLAPVARKRAGDLLLEMGHTADALHQYEELLARSPRHWLASEVRRRVDAMRTPGNP